MIYTSFEETFNVAVKIDLTFKTLVNVKVRCFKCEGYRNYGYQCPSESQHVRTDGSKVVEDVHIPPKTASIIEDLSSGSGAPIFDEANVSSDSTSDDVSEVVESNIPTMLSKLIEFPCPEYTYGRPY